MQFDCDRNFNQDDYKPEVFRELYNSLIKACQHLRGYSLDVGSDHEKGEMTKHLKIINALSFRFLDYESGHLWDSKTGLLD